MMPSGTVGNYKTYIIKNKPNDEERIKALMKLLDKNGIQYGTASGSGKGYNYHTGKEEAFTVSIRRYCSKCRTTQSSNGKSII